MGASSTAESPIDRAFSLLFSGEREAALHIAAPLAERDGSSAAPLLLAGRLLGELGRVEAAREALSAAAARSVDLGNLPLAVAAARELGRFGGDEAAAIAAVAEAFCKGSRRASGAASPPPMPPMDVAPLDAKLSGAALLDAAGAAISAASKADKARSRPAVRPVPLFSALGREALRGFLSAWEPQWLPGESAVIEQGAVGDDAYVVARGEVEVRRRSGDKTLVLAQLARGEIFGEMALLARAPRAAGVVASRPVIVLCVARAALDAVADQHPDVGVELSRHCQARMVENLLRTSPVLAVVPSPDRPALMDRFETRIFEAHQKLVRQDEPSPGLYLLASGEVSIVRREAGDAEPLLLATLGPGDVTGEVAMVLRRRANADVIARCPVVTLFLPASEFLGLIHDHPAMLAELYLLAVARDEETLSVISQEASAAEDFILV